MNTLLMEAYEALMKLLLKSIDRGFNDPQADALRSVMGELWDKMERDEQSILEKRGIESVR